ncbi:MAG: CHAT domain-containing protein [Caldilineaceae bacterium]
MCKALDLCKTEFIYGNTKIHILQGDILKPGITVQVVVSTDDNYLTMGSGVAQLLRQGANCEQYMREAQTHCPAKAGTVVVTKPYDLKQLLGVRRVFHGTVIDYDSDAQSLPDLVEQTSQRCLEQAEALGFRTILFPAFATGAGMLSMEECARRMCNGLKTHLGHDRPLKDIYIMLYLPEAVDTPAAATRTECAALNQRFIREANLVLGVPYDPVLRTPQIRDFIGGSDALQRLEAVITGKMDDSSGKRHAVILGGPAIGKQATLDYIYQRSKKPDDPLGNGRRLVRVTFGRVHEQTPPSFIYHKLLCALGKTERGKDSNTKRLLEELRQAYSDPQLDCKGFLDLLARHRDHYPEVVFLIDRLPNLLGMEGKESNEVEGNLATSLGTDTKPEPPLPWDFWRDLDEFGKHVRIVYTARTEEFEHLRQQRLEPFAPYFLAQIEPIWLGCVTDEERRQWVDELFRRYLDCGDGAPAFVHARYAVETGRHPYLITLYSRALVEAIKTVAFDKSDHVVTYGEDAFAPIFQVAVRAIAKPQREFFEQLMAAATPADLEHLRKLARTIVIDEKCMELIDENARGDTQAGVRWRELQEEREKYQLDPGRLISLEQRGYLVDAAQTVQFMAKPFAEFVIDYFGLRHTPAKTDHPTDIEITLISVAEVAAPHMVQTMVRGRGARVSTAQKELSLETRRSFLDRLGKCLDHWLHRSPPDGRDWWQDPEQVGSYILNQFTTSDIKRYLQEPPEGTTILLAVDEALKSIPWELMLEATYAGEIPFRVGRSIVGQQPNIINEVVREGHALLIGDPTDDLASARREVEELATSLGADRRFHIEQTDVLLGSEQCHPGRILNALGSRRYGLVHYSGHTHYDGYRSAWQLAGGERITTSDLTSALQMGPPAFVFSSSCESAMCDAVQPIKYEDQTYDLPSAFLQAGVEAYVGALWSVDEEHAFRFVDRFYSAFLAGDANLGECMRRAKWAGKKEERQSDGINWLSFILYGDPHLMPKAMFVAM